MTEHGPNLRSGRNGKSKPAKSGSEFSEAEFERIEDNLDGISRSRGLSRPARPRSKKRSGLFAVALIVMVYIVVVVGIDGHGSPKPPTCTTRSHDCRETSNGYWVPLWYYTALASAQNIPSGGSGGGSVTGSGSVPTTAGTLPTAAQLAQAGATPAESGEAQSYGQAQASDDGGDDSGSDDSGDDGGGDGGDGGGDGGGGD